MGRTSALPGWMWPSPRSWTRPDRSAASAAGPPLVDARGGARRGHRLPYPRHMEHARHKQQQRLHVEATLVTSRQPLAADPGGVEAVGHALGHADFADWAASDVVGVEDGQVGLLLLVVPHVAHQVAVVFFLPVVPGRKRCLAKPFVYTRVVGGAGILLQVVAREAAKTRVLGAV